MIEKRRVRDIEIACWTNRQAWKADRKTIVFIHGSGGDSTAWVYQYSQLADSCNMAALELPGHGSSGGKGETDVAAYVSWVRDILLSFEIHQPVLVGHSLGAAICLAFAIQYPDLLSGIVPFGGGVKMPVNPAILEGVQKDPAAILAFTAKIAVARKNRERLAPILAKRTPDPEILYGDFLACDRLDLTGEIGSIRTPTLIVCGTEDKMTPPALSESLREMIPGARLALIPEAGHLVMMEEPEGFNEALRSFVAELDGRK